MCVSIFSAVLSEIFLILRRSERDMIKDVYWSSCIVAAILVRFKCNLNFLGRFSKKQSHIKFEIVHVVHYLQVSCFSINPLIHNSISSAAVTFYLLQLVSTHEASTGT